MSRVRLWAGDLLLGARISLGGGRTSWVRLALTGVGVGLGVLVLLAAASAPNTIGSRRDRQEATQLILGQQPIAGVDPLYAAYDDKSFRGHPIMGNYVTPGGAKAPLPPGTDRFPGDGEILLSPALAELLASPEGEQLRPRFPQKVVGTVGQAGLNGPNSMVFIAGDASITHTARNAVYRYGLDQRNRQVDPVLWLLVLVGMVVLLFPVLVFISISTRLAGPERDHRLAALRLIGAGSQRVRRIAAGEALLGAGVGVVVGTVLFAVGRQFAENIELFGISVFVSDLTPSPALALLIFALVPVMAVVGALFAMRHTVVEPLGVVRQGKPINRKLWWRLIPVAAGVALLALQAGVLTTNDGQPSELALAGGICLLLLGIPVLLPWLVERSVTRVRGGAPAWQLAIRRLQMDSATAARVVGGVAVVLAGGIALQTVMASAQAGIVKKPWVESTRNMLDFNVRGVAADRFGEIAMIVAESKGVRSVEPSRVFSVDRGGGKSTDVLVTSCAELRRISEIDGCVDGDAFEAVAMSQPDDLKSGELVTTVHGYGSEAVKGPQWTIPQLKPARGNVPNGLMVTPGALRGLQVTYTSNRLFATLDPAVPDAADRALNAVGAYGWQVQGQYLGGSDPTAREKEFLAVRRALLAGSLITLLLAGSSLLVLALEQVRARRRPLAVLAASGVPRSTLAWSLLWQNALPLLLAMVVALATGVGLGVLLLRVISQPLTLDFAGMGVLAGASAVLIVVVTLMTLPALRQATGALGLRSE